MIHQAVSNQTLPPTYHPVTEIPALTIHTARVTLQAGGIEHIASHKTLDSDRDNQKYQCLSSSINDDLYQGLMKWLDASFAGTSSETNPIFSWLLETREPPNKHIGYVELSVVDATTLRLGCVITSGEHGKGYASEACYKVLEWAQSLPNVKVIQGLCHPENTGSRKLMERLGMRYQRLTPDEHVFPNYNPKGSGQEERSKMEVWAMCRNEDGEWPKLPQRDGTSLNTCFTTPIASHARANA